MGRVKGFIKNNADFIVPIIIVVILFLVARSWLQYDVRAIDVGFQSTEEDIDYFTYEGNTYYEIAYMESLPIPYGDLEKECIGRAKGTAVVLYILKNDPSHWIIIGENPINDMIIYSCKYKEIPRDGDVSGVYFHLSFNAKYISDGMDKFQRFWAERYKNEPIILDEDSINKPFSLLCMFCFDGCPLPPNKVQDHFAYKNGKWYFAEYQTYIKNQEYKREYLGYPIEDAEMIDYLDEYIKNNLEGKVNWESTEL